MHKPGPSQDKLGALFEQAAWYERTIDWTARIAREVPLLREVFGPPGKGRILDAGCGTGHQARALAGAGYDVLGADVSEAMIDLGRRATQPSSGKIEYLLSHYRNLREATGGGFGGLYCIGNSLAAAGTRQDVQEAIGQFAQCLKPGGRLFVQILNFPLMRAEDPCVRGPKAIVVDGVEYVSVRRYQFIAELVQITKLTLFRDPDWQCRLHTGTVYPITLHQLRNWFESYSLRVDSIWGSYAREPFDPDRSTDLLVVATRK